MENRKHPILKIEKLAGNKSEQKTDVPIIDVIRHGETEYKQKDHGFHKSLRLNAKTRDFKLDADYLDLEEKGIEGIEKAANQIADVMDKENEVVLIVSSPAWRTHSSALVLEKVLRERGVNILNTEREPKFSKAINQHSYFFEKVLKRDYGEDDRTPKIISDYLEKGFKAGLAEAREAFGVDIQEKMREMEHSNFLRFLRHLKNIYSWLGSDTLKKLKGKKLRIILTAHEENTLGLIREAMPEGTVHNKGQILEIT